VHDLNGDLHLVGKISSYFDTEHVLSYHTLGQDLEKLLLIF